MKCLICNSNMQYFFSKKYDKEPFTTFMNKIGEIDYYKCINCGFVISKTHKNLCNQEWQRINNYFHHYMENNDSTVKQPPYLEQASMLKVLVENDIVDITNALDFGGGYGTFSKILNKYFKITLPVYDPYIQNKDFDNYVNKEKLSKYKTVFNSALFEHLLTREAFDEINNLVSDGGCMIIHTVICENIPKDPNWFYIEPPVHTTFHTNKSMGLLMEQWGYESSIYCPSSKSWILLKNHKKETKEKIIDINKEFQTEYLIYKKGFVDYWKGF